MPMPRTRLLLIAVLVLLALGAGASVVRYVPAGHLGVVRSAGGVRRVPSGIVLVNPLRESLDTIPSREQEVQGVASVPTRDGFTVRIPFTARVALAPREFDAALGDRGGLEPMESATRGIRAGLETWGSTYDATDFLRPGLEPLAAAAVTEAGRRLGIVIRDLDLQPVDRDLYVLLAEDALVHGNPEERLGLIEGALAQRPDDWHLLTARGLLYEAAEDTAAAEKLYLQALAVEPGAEDPLGRLFVMLRDQGRSFQLEQLLGTAYEANPTSIKVLNWMALNYVALGRYGDASRWLEEARDLAPRDEGTLMNLGAVYQRLGDHDEAARTYREALEAAPGDPELLQNLGLAELSRGDLPAAREALEAAAASLDTVQVHNLLAEAYRRSGMKKEATAQLLASYELDREQPGLRDALTRMLGHPPD